MYTRLCLDPLASLPSFVFRIRTVLSIQRTNRFDVARFLCMYIFLSYGFVHLTDNHTMLMYKKYQSSCLASTTFWDAVQTYWLADADAINIMCFDKFTDLKGVEAVCGLRYEMPHPSPVRSSQYIVSTWSV